MARRLYEQARDRKKITIFYLGDWDPSGKDIERDVTDRLRDWGFSRDLIERVAIFQKDIREFNLPPLRVKDKDPRASKFKRQHGNEAVELDALPPMELRRRLRQAIDEVIDHEAWDRAKLVERAQRETCARYAGILQEMART